MTRAVIQVSKWGEDDRFFYSHCDGYPQGLLVDLMKIDNKEDYNMLIHELKKSYEEVDGIPGDVDFTYVVDYTKRKVYSYTDRKYHLIRVDSLSLTSIEIDPKF